MKTYEIVGLLAELGVVLADEGVGCIVLGGLYFDAATLNVKSLSLLQYAGSANKSVRFSSFVQ